MAAHKKRVARHLRLPSIGTCSRSFVIYSSSGIVDQHTDWIVGGHLDQAKPVHPPNLSTSQCPAGKFDRESLDDYFRDCTGGQDSQAVRWRRHCVGSVKVGG